MTTNSEHCLICDVDHHEPGAPKCKAIPVTGNTVPADHDPQRSRRHFLALLDRIRSIVKRPTVRKSVPCGMCGTVVELESMTSPHPEAPELLRTPHGAWMFLVSNETGPGATVYVVCSNECAQKLLKE